MSTLHKMVMATVLVALTILMSDSLAQASSGDPASLDRGRYLVQIGGCNDCHTPGYSQSAGQVPEAQWLTGDSLGWRGPWGTTYPANLRLYMQNLTEEQWLAVAHNLKTRPPMPWFDVRAMSTEDLGAIYRFIKSLGPAGKPAPAYVPPDREPKGPYILFPKAPQ